MTTQDYTDRTGSDFAGTDARFAELLSELDWLSAEDARLIGQAVRQLRRNIRSYTFHDAALDIDISATATANCVTVIVEDSGPEVTGVVRNGRRDPAGSGDHRLRVLDWAFDQVTYDRALGRNRWILRRFAQRSIAPVAARLAAVA